MQGYSLKKFFRSPLPTQYLPYLLLGLTFLGFLDAVYLTIVHYKNLIPPCTIGGCEVVLTSQYSSVGPFPLSLYGAAFYLAVIGLTALFITSYFSGNPEHKEEKLRRSPQAQLLSTLLFVLCLSGLAVGLFLVYLQVFVLHAFCQYCLLSELIDFLMFDTAWWMYNSLKKE